jgi:hypothetical protein
VLLVPRRCYWYPEGATATSCIAETSTTRATRPLPCRRCEGEGEQRAPNSNKSKGPATAQFAVRSQATMHCPAFVAGALVLTTPITATILHAMHQAEPSQLEAHTPSSSLSSAVSDLLRLRPDHQEPKQSCTGSGVTAHTAAASRRNRVMGWTVPAAGRQARREAKACSSKGRSHT